MVGVCVARLVHQESFVSKQVGLHQPKVAIRREGRAHLRRVIATVQICVECLFASRAIASISAGSVTPMVSLADLARLQAKLHELCRMMDDILVDGDCGQLVPSTYTPPPSPSRSTCPPQVLPLLTPVRGTLSLHAGEDAISESVGSLRTESSFVWSSPRVPSAILNCDNITRRRVNKPGVAADPFPTVDSESQENQSSLDENLPRRCLLFSARGKR